jgi:hypothetical protein
VAWLLQQGAVGLFLSAYVPEGASIHINLSTVGSIYPNLSKIYPFIHCGIRGCTLQSAYELFHLNVNPVSFVLVRHKTLV